ncbi:polcalcin Nic t 2-like [Coregonus clupeaformis]|uniref:polcalcin Nic t 2-like n=1 Tax=Coregonus clupeaformis TaxID=59861 RepID=UPI001BE04531|nr:polcalcin Nic t 2-like [Coregonus clupeaformis]
MPSLMPSKKSEQFAKNNDGSINEKGLASTLDRVGISISPEEVKKALQKADYNKDGEVGFQDFLHVMRTASTSPSV